MLLDYLRTFEVVCFTQGHFAEQHQPSRVLLCCVAVLSTLADQISKIQSFSELSWQAESLKLVQGRNTQSGSVPECQGSFAVN